MSKLVASFFISLDGVVESPDKWHFPYFNDEMGQAVGGAIAATDTMLLGRRTYEEFAAYWPHQDPAADPFVSIMNETPKFVVSTTLEKVEWQNSTLLQGDLAEAVNELKARPGKNIGCREAPRSCGRCSRAAFSTSCGCSCTRSSSGPARSCSRTARRRGARAGRLEDVLDRRPRPHLSTGGRMSGHGRCVPATDGDRLRRRRRRPGADPGRRRVQLPPL